MDHLSHFDHWHKLAGQATSHPYNERSSPPEPIMTQQQLLQQARNVLTATVNDHGRHCLQTAAVATGRSVLATRKASTMRLALWVSKGTSAI